MSFVTNQFLQGGFLRNRSHYPVGVSMSVNTDRSAWCKDRKVFATLSLAASHKGHQHVYFTKSDISKVLPELAPLANKKAIEKITKDYSVTLNDEEFIDYLSKLISSRVQKKDDD